MDTPVAASPHAASELATLKDPRRAALARGKNATWVLPAQVAVLALAAVVYIFNLTVSGYANTFYSMAAQAAAQDWSSWFWGSLDPSNFITVDKPPLATMLMGLSVRVFGLSSWSILLPEALCGVATIAVLYVVVRRTAGPVAATIAALVAALTPAAVLMFRYNNPDALLTLLLVLAAWAFLRALADGRLRWIVLAALFVGLAFNTKFLQAYLVLPVFAIVYAIAAPVSIRRRIVGLGVALLCVLIFSGWWVIAVQLVPADMRPYIGGSSDGSALQLLFGYDGLGRIFGQLAGGGVPTGVANAPGGGPGAPGGGVVFGGIPGFLRMFNRDFGGQVAWLLPFAGIGAISSLALRWRRPRTDLARAAILMWTLWLVVHVLVFSFMSGIIHSYYTVVMAPAIGALVGTGAVDLWRARTAHRNLAGLALAASIASTAALGWQILQRTPNFLPGLSTVVLIVGVAAAVVIAVLALLPATTAGAAAKAATRISLAAATIGLVAIMAGPTAYAVDTMSKPYDGGDPSAGPTTARAKFAGLPGFGGFGPTRPDDDRAFRPPTNDGAPPDGAAAQPDGINSPIAGGPIGVRSAGGLGQAELEYLVANRGRARWIVAARSSSQAAPIQLATGEPVMAVGGFNGSDPVPTLDQLKAYIASGELRYVIATGAGFGGFGQGLGEVSAISNWVRSNCTLVSVPGGNAADLYDCAAAASSNL